MSSARSAGLALAALLLALSAAAQPPEEARRVEAARLMNELMLGREVGGDFALRDARGRRVRLADFRGKLVVLYFGFTSCPDVCPTDLFAIGRAVKSLGRQAGGVQPVFVTLDPARDKPAVIAEYVANFHPRFVALTGSEDQIRAVAKAYKVFYEKVSIESALGYTIDHAAFTYLIDSRGQYIGFIPPGTPYERIARLIRSELQTP